MPLSVNEGLWRIGGHYGEAVRDGQILAELIEITGQVEVARVDVPLVGRSRMGHKPGRETREGTLRIQKIDSRWEREMMRFLSQTLESRRALRGTGQAPMRPFNLQVVLDDPDALGVEALQLTGCVIWRLPIGFNITEDLMLREIPFTWEEESFLADFVRTGVIDEATGYPKVEQHDIRSGAVAGG